VYLGNTPPAAMTNVTVYDSGRQPMAAQIKSLREFIKGDNSDEFLFDDVPDSLMYVYSMV